MSILDGIKGLFGGGSGPARAERNTRMVYIVDADHLQEGRGNPGPAERAGLLQRLAQFAQREEIRLQVVLGGRPLREAAHGEDFNGITVFYAEQGGGMAEQVAALYGKAGSAALVITSDREVEQKIDAGNAAVGATGGIAANRGNPGNRVGHGNRARSNRPPKPPPRTKAAEHRVGKSASIPTGTRRAAAPPMVHRASRT